MYLNIHITTGMDMRVCEYGYSLAYCNSKKDQF